jgi:ABC-2 family transporter protein
MPDLRLISAEVLKLRRRRGMLAIAILLTLGLVLLVFAVTGIQHASDPAKHGPAGGAASYHSALDVLTLMALVVGAIVGGTAGTQDIESGVFRDLAATGRSRVALFTARAFGGWAIVLPILAATMTAAAVLSVVLADGTATPTAAAIVAGTAGVMLAGAVSTAMAVGTSALVGSRGPVIGVLLAFYLALQPLLVQVGLLGGGRRLIPSVGLARIGHMTPAGDVRVALGTAVAVLIGWIVAPLVLGAWRTRTREI